jgi:hypothetical protein
MCWRSEICDSRSGENFARIQIQGFKKSPGSQIWIHDTLFASMPFSSTPYHVSPHPLNFISFWSLVLSFLSSETFREDSLSLLLSIVLHHFLPSCMGRYVHWRVGLGVHAMVLQLYIAFSAWKLDSNSCSRNDSLLCIVFLARQHLPFSLYRDTCIYRMYTVHSVYGMSLHYRAFLLYWYLVHW